MAKNILGENDQIYKNGPGEANGIGDGMYDVHHKLLRYKKSFDTNRNFQLISGKCGIKLRCDWLEKIE